ncbi:multicopper oxidase family protein [Ottowia thiooxydans]|uniref:multicopper oxidase family protein n=1 Tax=Ottowia thiooxydans TaxID=219182 RepID=UPI00040F298E|nr:multicopper oxidase family protein [Ottowia thiooxydans]
MIESSSTDDTRTPINQPSRRATLQWMFGMATGTAVLPLAGCGSGVDDGTEDTLPEPQVLTSVNGKLELELNAQYTTQTLDIAQAQPPAYPGKATPTQTHLRSFNGQYAAPTLIVNQGDTLRILLNNRLPANTRQTGVEYLNFQNSTNLHFHGLHVDPREIRPGVFGDYVVDTADGGVLPGQSRQHELAIRSDHQNGIYWYHPHLHGSSNGQVSSGMFGAIIIRDLSDRFITSPDIRERVIFVHKVSLNEAGRTDSFKDSVNAPTSAFMLNGAYQPTIVMRPGEVQNWHLINSSSFYPFNPVLDDHTFWAYAKDGNVYDRQFKPINAGNANQFTDANWPGNALYPGNRHSIVVKASDKPGTYLLRAVKAPSSEVDEEIVARIVVEGSPINTPLPSASDLPRYKDHVAITDQELAANGGKQRNLVLAVLNKDDDRILKPIPEGENWFAPPEEGFMANTVFSAGAVGAKLVPFQSSLTVTQTVALDAVEEWTIHSLNGYPHPFHIHVNDSYIVRVNGLPVTPFWADTIPVPPTGNVTFRMRFSDFKGKFVWHCHALDHEDMGMMQLVDVVA